MQFRWVPDFPFSKHLLCAEPWAGTDQVCGCSGRVRSRVQRGCEASAEGEVKGVQTRQRRRGRGLHV